MNTKSLSQIILILPVGLLCLSACEEKSQVATQNQRPKVQKIQKQITKSPAKKWVTKKVLTAEEKEIQELLREGQEALSRETQSRQVTCAFHYRIARQIFNGSLKLPVTNPSRITDLNKARRHLIMALQYVKDDTKSWALFLKVDSYLGQPESINASVTKEALAKRRAQKEQKQMEFKVDLLAAEKLAAEGKHDAAIREFDRLNRQLQE